MDAFVVDTMAWVLWLEKRKLPLRVKQIMGAMVQGDVQIYVPTIVLAELLYLHERQRITISLSQTVAYMNEHATCLEAYLTTSTLQVASDIDDIPELHDRLITASAVERHLPLISNDPVIARSVYLTTAIWR